MDDREGVGGAQRIGRLLHDAAHLFGGELPAALDPPAERLAVDVPHHEIHEIPARRADVEDRHHVGMGEPRSGLRLAREARADLLLEGEFGRKDLDGDPSMQALIPGAVDHAHPTAADLPFYRVCPRQRLLEPLGEGGLRAVGH